MIVNGLPAEDVQYRIDGQVAGLSREGFTNRTGLTQGSPDAIEEIAITTSNFSAEFGSVGGALFNVTMKSGSNQYHGSAYDYMVNEALNAYDATSNINGVRARNKNRRNNWGFTIGGPVKIPYLYDGTNKTFFFWSLDYLKQTSRVQSGAGNTRTVPTEAYRKGDFSTLPGLSTANPFVTVGNGAICAPGQTSTTARPCSRYYIDVNGNQIANGTLFNPASIRDVVCNKTVVPSADCVNGTTLQFRDPLLGNNLLNAQIVSPITGKSYTGLDPVAVKVLSYVPAPTLTTTAANNYFVPFGNDAVNRIPSLKIDHNISSVSRISLTMQETYQNQPRFNPDGFDAPITTSIANKSTSPSIRMNYDQTLTPTLQLRVGAGWTQFDLDRQLNFTFDPATQLGFTGTFMHRYFPRFEANTVAGTTTQWGGLSAVGTSGVALSLERRPSGNVSLTWIRNSHTIRFGGEWRMDMLPNINPDFSDGRFSGFQGNNGVLGQPQFNNDGGITETNNNTGFNFASFLVGGAGTFELRSPISYRTSKHQWGAFVQDTWRAKRNLTIDLGLRWDMGTYTKEDYGRNAVLSLTTPNPLYGGRLGAIDYEATCQCQFAKNYPYGFGPRLGFAYTLNPKTVIRGGFGMSYGSTGAFGGYASNANPTQPTTPFDSSFLMREGVPTALTPLPWPSFSPTLGHAGPTSLTFPAGFQVLDPNAGRPSRTFQWNFSLQREITRNFVIEATYLGNRGIWQSNPALTNLNQLTPEIYERYGFDPYNVNDYTLLRSNYSNAVSAANRARLVSAGIITPYPTFPVTTQFVMQQLVPFPQYGFFGTPSTINPQRAPLGRSWYDALQLQLNKRYSHGLMVNANYTLSKNLGLVTPADMNNPNYDNKDIHTNNLPQQIRVTFQYQTPRPPSWVPVVGQRWLAYALEGWGISMSMRYQPGFFLGRPSSGAVRPITNLFPGGGGIGAQLKKDADGNFLNPWSKDWVDYDGVRHTEPLDINCHCFDPERTQLLDPTVWEAVPDLTWPSQTQQLTFFRGPRQPQESGNISRNFRFGKDGRFTLNIRAEFQNLFNRRLLPFTMTLGNFNTGVTRNAIGRATAGFGTFGDPATIDNYGRERTGTFVGRLTF
jgi:hypothetical protein